MKKFLFLFLFFGLCSCFDRDVEPDGPGEPRECDQDVVRDASGRKYPFLDPTVLSYCGPGWGIKFCRFLGKYDETVWADADNYYSDFSDIKFSSFSYDGHFISFFNLDRITSYCQGWKLGETTSDGKKWNIKIKRDQEDELWFDYEYFGSSEEIEYTITYKYEVIDGLLHFSSSEDQTFIFTPSEKLYSIDSLNTDEIVVLEGCMFE